MYTEDSYFYLLDCNNDIVEAVYGYQKLVEYTVPAIKSGRIQNSFKNQIEENQPLMGWRKTEFVVVDSEFRVVPIHLILSNYTEPTGYRSNRYYNGNSSNWVYRKDPVSGTGIKTRYRHYRRALYRKQQIMSEVRSSYGNEEYIRGRRKRGAFSIKARIYDEEIRSDFFIKRSWKKIKKQKQWM